MSRNSVAGGKAGGIGGVAKRGLALDASQAQQMVIGARNALFVMSGVLAALWVVQIFNWSDQYRLILSYGIRPRDVASLPYLFTAPFLHFSWTHIEGNSGPLFIFGFLAAYRGIAKFAGVTVVVVVTSGLAAWFFEAPNSVGAGASGVVFGYFGYIIVRGLFDRHAIDVLIGAVMALCFAYQFAVLLPHQGIGWQAHAGGLAGGIASGWIFRDHRAKARRPAAAAAAAAGSLPAPGTAISPVSGSSSPARSLKPGGQKQGGKGPAVDPANPRADLYKQLDDLGL